MSRSHRVVELSVMERSTLLHSWSTTSLQSVRHGSEWSIQRVVLTLLLLLRIPKLLHIVHVHGHVHAASRRLLLWRLSHLHAQLVLHALQMCHVLLVAHDTSTLLRLHLLLLMLACMHASLSLCAYLLLLLLLLVEHLFEPRRKAGDDLRRDLTVVLLEERIQLLLSLVVSESKLLPSLNLILLLLLHRHAVHILHIALLLLLLLLHRLHLLHLHRLHLLLILLLLVTWVRVTHLWRLLLHVHTWAASIACHLLPLCHLSFHRMHLPLQLNRLFLRLLCILDVPNRRLLLPKALIMLESLLNLCHVVGKLYMLGSQICGISSWHLPIWHTLARIQLPLCREHGDLCRC
jgi:hypothetical protein